MLKHKANYDIKVTCLQHDNSILQSALDALQKEATEDKQRLSLGIIDFEKGMRENSVNADTLISVPNPSTRDIPHVLAHNALVKVRLENWSSAYEDAQKVMLHSLIGELMSTHPHVKSIDTQPSAMGYITKALAQIGMGQPEEAMQIFDLAFGNCNPKESNMLLLIKVCDPYESQVSDTPKRLSLRPPCYLWPENTTQPPRAFRI